MLAVLFMGVLLLLPATVYPQDKIEPLGMNAGLWEVTTTTNSPKDGPTISAEQLEGLSPDNLHKWNSTSNQERRNGPWREPPSAA